MSVQMDKVAEAEPKLADHIEVVQRRGTFSLKIDGREFPWFITDDGVQTSVSGVSMAAVTVTILANKLEITNDWS